MRLWSLHPQHLDRAALVAAWREALLAQAVLAGKTSGYRSHPQLIRFREAEYPIDAIGAFLQGLYEEASHRGYQFNAKKILQPSSDVPRIPVTLGQIEYEWEHLGAKLEARDPAAAQRWREETPTPHPLFSIQNGDIEPWERVPNAPYTPQEPPCQKKASKTQLR